MTTTILISICALLLFAYFFDITSSKTKIPSVILLLLTGWLAKQITVFLGITMPDLSAILPVLGTAGLILIVLEGSLELELDKSKWRLIGKSSVMALFPILLLSVGWAYIFQIWEQASLKNCLINAIPLAVISSAIAIPSARNLKARDREFITYESSLSDIFGVILFNFIAFNEVISAQSIGHFLMELFFMLIVSFVATLGLSFLLSRIKHHVKFTPIIISIILIYAISKVYHLPALIFILLFGLFLGNLDRLKNIDFISWLHPEILDKEVHKFKEITIEMTFLARTLFFLLFGFLIENSELLNTHTIAWAILITISIFILRALFLKILKLPTNLLFIAPRGLITILLFLSIPISQSLEIANKSLVLQVIILTAIVMMYGSLISKKGPVKLIHKIDITEDTPSVVTEQNTLSDIIKPAGKYTS